MKDNKNKTLKMVLAVVILAALIGALVLIYKNFSPKPTAGAKSVTIEVVDDQADTTSYEVNTDAEYLRQVMEETDGLTFSGAESEYGMTVDTVNGIRADYNENGAYWSFYLNDDYCNYGIDTQPVADGDHFSIVYTRAE